MKHILVVAESIDIDKSSGAKANMALIKNLIKAGFRIKVYHYSIKKIDIEGAESVLITENRKSLLFFLSRTERYIRYFFKLSLNPKIEKKTGFSFTLKNDRNSILSVLRKERGFKPDWILTLSQGGSFRPHHALLKMPERHSKWIAYIHDPYPMHWYPKPYTWKESGYQIKQKFMEEVADKCQYAAFPSLYLKEWMGNHYKAYWEKGIIIPHQLNEEFETKEASFLKIDLKEFIILHAGNFLQARQPKGLIEGFKKFIQRNPTAKIRLIHVGPTSHYKAYLNGEAEKLPQFQGYFGNYPFNEVAWLQEKASVNLIIEAKADFSPFLPGKFPHCIAAGKPILLLGPSKSEARRLLGNEYPWWAEIDDEERISNIIGRLYLNWEKEKNKYMVHYENISYYLSKDFLKRTIEEL